MPKIINDPGLEEKLINQFKTEFYEKMGYYPIVITNSSGNSKKSKIVKLNELEKYFDEHLPTIYGKRHSLGSKNRSRSLVELRFIFFFIARQMKYTLPEIGQYLNGRDHTTVIHGLKTFNNLYQTDEKFKDTSDTIINNIKNKHESSTMVYTD